MWRLCIDTGGTFTDCVAVDPAGVKHRVKVLSNASLRGEIIRRAEGRRVAIDASWLVADDFVKGLTLGLLGTEGWAASIVSAAAGASTLELDAALPPDVALPAAFEVRTSEPAPILAARLVTRTPAGAALPPAAMRLATTRGTNALLERAGAPVALFITEGFGDLLTIGDQQRPDLFALEIKRAEPLHSAVVEVAERVAADGAVLCPPDLERVGRDAAELRQRGVEVAAIAFLNSYCNPDHEEQVARVLHDAGFAHVAVSSRLAPVIKLLPRAETAVVEAYLGPVIATYLDAVGAGLGGRPLHVMTSAAGLVRADLFPAHASLLSGPAGGVAGAVSVARGRGESRVIGLDMGGTSTDVARWDGDYDYRFEHEVAGVRLASPALAIETVAAGGGSICSFAHGRLEVGPESAGADPGPSCYGAGGPLTLTDVNLLLGRLDAAHFGIPIARADADAACTKLEAEIAASTGTAPDRLGLLCGLLAIANERMADAIAQASIARGVDPAGYPLMAFGGAAGQHACAIADRIGMRTVIMPADAPVLSAVGLAHAVLERFALRQVLRPLADVGHVLPDWLTELGVAATDRVAAEGVPRDRIVVRRRIVRLRLLGQESAIEIDVDDDLAGRPERLAAHYRRLYAAMYGHEAPSKPIEVESLRIVASATDPAQTPTRATPSATGPANVAGMTDHEIDACFGGAWVQTRALARDRIPEDGLEGPALVLDRGTALVVEPGWYARLDAAANVIAERRAKPPEAGRRGDAAKDAPRVVQEELFLGRLTAIARSMGRQLQRTAVSTNVKERLDFSCAVLDPDGRLVVNAPHIPVHLGALGSCVRGVRAALDMEDGDVVVTNHPAFGGSHLPDVTVITPVHVQDGRLVGYVANRAHHAEIGGIRPGSMPPSASTLAEEGVVLAPCFAVRGGAARLDRIASLLTHAPAPSRAVADNMADLRAQIAANQRGREALRALAGDDDPDELLSRMAALTGRTETVMRAALGARRDERLEAATELDDGAPVRVQITIAGDEAIVDFAGSAQRHPGNLNATPAIVRSAVMYVLRVMIGPRARGVPLNDGLLAPIDLRIPTGILNPVFDDDPAIAPAVGGGNVETSQRIVEVLLQALGLCASSQGTMNNVIFGTDDFGYYETVGGGAGAGPGFAGADGVHTHMTNTRITDPEIVEHRYPVRLERFAVRRGSGGQGQFRGGDGLIRCFRFLAPMDLSILSQHRREGPLGAAGGGAGAPGRQRLIRASGAIVDLPACGGCAVESGDTLEVETPGGGGWGMGK